MWKKRDDAQTVKDVVLRNTKMTEEELVNTKRGYNILGLQKAVDVIKTAIANKQEIFVYGDYDADGITSVSILHKVLEYFNATFYTYIPRRISDGYGLKMNFVERIIKKPNYNGGLLITVDNGISAVDEIEFAKNNGLTVVVIDHHLMRDDGKLPPADVIVNPSAIPGSDFSNYCGAGLSYKLAELLCDNPTILSEICVLAAIGTIADVMPVLGDNRNIIKDGLTIMNERRSCLGLRVLLDKLRMRDIDETDIGFKIGPIINACGRMEDAGANIPFKLLTTSDAAMAHRCADRMIATNETRKDAVKDEMDQCEKIIAENCMYGEVPLVVYTTKDSQNKFREGLVGILAGRLCEKYGCPAIVLTETEDGVLKGSGRSNTIHLKELLDTVSDKMVTYGGHAGAAGLSVRLSDIDEFISAIQENTADLQTPSSENNIIEYDLDISADKVADTIEQLKLYAPYGEGNPHPVFKVSDIKLTPKSGKFYQQMGSEGQHVRLYANNFTIVGFGLTEKYINLGSPFSLDVVGNLSENRFDGTVTKQVEATDMKVCEIRLKQTPLASALAERMKAKGLFN